MATQAEKAKSFRKLHVPGEPLVLFNIWDPGSAKVLAETAAMALANWCQVRPICWRFCPARGNWPDGLCRTRPCLTSWRRSKSMV